jgi:hypothetical protein
VIPLLRSWLWLTERNSFLLNLELVWLAILTVMIDVLRKVKDRRRQLEGVGEWESIKIT